MLITIPFAATAEIHRWRHGRRTGAASKTTIGASMQSHFEESVAKYYGKTFGMRRRGDGNHRHRWHVTAFAVGMWKGSIVLKLCPQKSDHNQFTNIGHLQETGCAAADPRHTAQAQAIEIDSCIRHTHGMCNSIRHSMHCECQSKVNIQLKQQCFESIDRNAIWNIRRRPHRHTRI